jgi:hypothetical protein
MIVMIACVRAPDTEFVPQFNIFCLINEYSRYTPGFIVIDRTYSLNERSDYDLQDALVVIRDSVRSETLEYGYGRQFYRPHHINMDTMQTLKIMVATTGLDTLYGETTVPGNFNIRAPYYSDTVGPGDTLIFTKSRGAMMYGIYLDGPDPYNFYTLFPDFFPDSVIKLPLSLITQDTTVTTGLCFLEISAFDNNYYNYKFHWESGTYPQYGVKGGFGAFGSAYTKSVVFYYRP